MQEKPHTWLQGDYDEIVSFAKELGEPITITKDGQADLVLMHIEAFAQGEELCMLQKHLLAAEQERLAGVEGYTVEQMQAHLEAVLDEMEEKN